VEFLKNYKRPVRYQQPKAPDNHIEKSGLVFLNAAAARASKSIDYNPDDVVCYGYGKHRRLKDCTTLSKAEKKAAYDVHNKQEGNSSSQDRERRGQSQHRQIEGGDDDDAGAATPTPEEIAQFDAFMQAWGVSMFNAAPNPVNTANTALVTKKVSFAEVVHTGTTKSAPVVPVPKPSKEDSVTLCAWKIYLGSCATYHSALVERYLENVYEVDTILKGSCNAGVTTSNTKGLFFWKTQKSTINNRLLTFDRNIAYIASDVLLMKIFSGRTSTMTGRRQVGNRLATSRRPGDDQIDELLFGKLNLYILTYST